jgi:hypothetical protein
MKAFALVALIPLVAARPDVAFTAFTNFGGATHGVHHAAPHHAVHHAAPVHHAVHHAAPVHHAVHAVHHAAPVHHAVHHAPAYGHPAPAYGHHAPAYAYEAPKHNCSVQDVVEAAEVCTPAFETVCAPVELPIKKIIDVEQCYDVTRTVCSESIEVVENEICVYHYEQKSEETTAQTVEVTFERICDTQMVTVCQPTPGYGYHSYGHNYCKEVAQETCYNSPVVTPTNPPVTVAYPEPIKTCVDKPISLPRISCEDLTENKCITVPEVEDDVAIIEKCITQLGAPDCSTVELTLPKQVCKEINYGYAEETHSVEPYEAPEPVTYAPAPAYAAAE